MTKKSCPNYFRPGLCQCHMSEAIDKSGKTKTDNNKSLLKIRQIKNRQERRRQNINNGRK